MEPMYFLTKIMKRNHALLEVFSVSAGRFVISCFVDPPGFTRDHCRAVRALVVVFPVIYPALPVAQ